MVYESKLIACYQTHFVTGIIKYDGVTEAAQLISIALARQLKQSGQQ